MTYYGYITDSSTHGAIDSRDPYIITVTGQPKFRRAPPYSLGLITIYSFAEEIEITGESEEAVSAKCADEIVRRRDGTPLCLHVIPL